MGDYTKVIVNCNIKKVPDLATYKQKFLEYANLATSAYHCGGELLEINNEWNATAIIFVTQLKYSRGLEEFIDWLRPQVVQGFSDRDFFALSCREDQETPTLYYLEEE